PPRVLLQMSTATIYSHRFDAPNDDLTGRLGGNEPDAPAHWKPSVDIALAWEEALFSANTPATRRVALRTAMVMSPDPSGPFASLLGLARWGIGGPIAGGRQFVSWIHHRDFARSIALLLDRGALDGVINVASPNPLP